MQVKFQPRKYEQIAKSVGLVKGGQLQKFYDLSVATKLQPYVSFKSGTQEDSILSSLDAGSGYVHIDVPYAEIQAYSKKIKKRVGKRGTRPFERMVSDKRNVILEELAKEARRIDNG